MRCFIMLMLKASLFCVYGKSNEKMTEMPQGELDLALGTEGPRKGKTRQKGTCRIRQGVSTGVRGSQSHVQKA